MTETKFTRKAANAAIRAPSIYELSTLKLDRMGRKPSHHVPTNTLVDLKGNRIAADAARDFSYVPLTYASGSGNTGRLSEKPAALDGSVAPVKGSKKRKRGPPEFTFCDAMTRAFEEPLLPIEKLRKLSPHTI